MEILFLPRSAVQDGGVTERLARPPLAIPALALQVPVTVLKPGQEALQVALGPGAGPGRLQDTCWRWVVWLHRTSVSCG